MRQAGELTSEGDARLFVDHLLTLGIEARTDRSGDVSNIWVYDENQLARSKQELAEFRENPRHERYAAAAAAASATRRQAAQSQRKIRKNIIEVRQQWESPPIRRQLVTWTVIGLAIAVAILTQGGAEHGPVMSALLISSPLIEEGESYVRVDGLSEVLHGQVWRLFTPSLLHFGPIHLLMNCYWMYYLGGMIERRKGSLFLAGLVLGTSLISNLAQYYFSGPNFGGLSGVVSGLFGYALVRLYWHQDLAYFLHPTTVFLFLATTLLAMTGELGPIANWAHGAGLLAGAAWAGLPELKRR